MPLLYEIPKALSELIDAGKADLFGAIIKHTATGQILGHVQQTNVAQNGLARVLGQAINVAPFLPLGLLDAITVFQNVKIAQGIAELQKGMQLVQNLQVGALALNGLGLGVAVAGFAVMHDKLKAIEKRLDATEQQNRELHERIDKRFDDLREDDLKAVFAGVEAELQNLKLLHDRHNPQRVAEHLQLSLTRATRQLERHFMAEADIANRLSAPLDLLDRLWTLAGAIRLCQNAAIEALFVANELRAAEKYGEVELDCQFKLLERCVPDELARLVGRAEQQLEEELELRRRALSQAHILRDGIKGGLRDLAGQISLAQALRDEGMKGSKFVREIRETNADLVFLMPEN